MTLMKVFEFHLISKDPNTPPPQLGVESGIRGGCLFGVTANSEREAIEKVAARPEVGPEGFAWESIASFSL